MKDEERLQILSTIQSIEDQIQTLQSTENEESQAEQLKSLQEELHTYQEMDTTLMNECENQKVILKNGEDHYLSSIEVWPLILLVSFVDHQEEWREIHFHLEWMQAESLEGDF